MDDCLDNGEDSCESFIEEDCKYNSTQQLKLTKLQWQILMLVNNFWLCWVMCWELLIRFMTTLFTTATSTVLKEDIVRLSVAQRHLS